MKAAVTETFSISGGKATWHNRSEQGEKTLTGGTFYVPNNAPPEFTGVLARALLKAPGHTLPLLPAGEAHIAEVGSTDNLTQYQITDWTSAQHPSGSITTATRPPCCRVGFP